MKITLIANMNSVLIGLTYDSVSEITIGREIGNTIAPLAADGLSRHHARIFFKEGRWFVEDLGSTNGTYRLGKPVSGVEELAERDMLQFGKFEVSVDAFDAGESAQESFVAPAPSPVPVAPVPVAPTSVPVNPSPVSPAPSPVSVAPSPAPVSPKPVSPKPIAPAAVAPSPVAPAPAPAPAPVPASPLSSASGLPGTAVRRPTLPGAKAAVRPGLKLPPKPAMGTGVKLPPKPALGTGLKLPPKPALGSGVKLPPKKPLAPALKPVSPLEPVAELEPVADLTPVE